MPIRCVSSHLTGHLAAVRDADPLPGRILGRCCVAVGSPVLAVASLVELVVGLVGFPVVVVCGWEHYSEYLSSCLFTYVWNGSNFLMHNWTRAHVWANEVVARQGVREEDWETGGLVVRGAILVTIGVQRFFDVWVAALYLWSFLSIVPWAVEPRPQPVLHFPPFRLPELPRVVLPPVPPEVERAWAGIAEFLREPGPAAAADPAMEEHRNRAKEVCRSYVKGIDTSDFGVFEFVAYRVIRSYVCGERYREGNPGFFKAETWAAIQRLRTQKIEVPDFATIDAYQDNAGNNQVRQLAFPAIRGESDLSSGIQANIAEIEEMSNRWMAACKPYMRGVADSGPDSCEYIMYRVLRAYVCGTRARAGNVPKLFPDSVWPKILRLRASHCVAPDYEAPESYQRSAENNPLRALASRFRRAPQLKHCIDEVLRPLCTLSFLKRGPSWVPPSSPDLALPWRSILWKGRS